MLPTDKFECYEKVSESNKITIFVGDGINDAPVLKRADIGISMGGVGADSAIEASDIVLVSDEVERIPQAIEISKYTRKIIKQNLIFAMGVKLIILLLSVFGYANMWLAVFFISCKHISFNTLFFQSVNLNINSKEYDTLSQITSLSYEELENIINNPKSSINYFIKDLDEKSLSKEDYYANAIIDLFDFKKLGIESLDIEKRNDIIKRLEEKEEELKEILKPEKMTQPMREKVMKLMSWRQKTHGLV